MNYLYAKKQNYEARITDLKEENNYIRSLYDSKFDSSGKPCQQVYENLKIVKKRELRKQEVIDSLLLQLKNYDE